MSHLGKVHIIQRRRCELLANARRAGMRQNLIDATAGHDIAAQKQAEGIGNTGSLTRIDGIGHVVCAYGAPAQQIEAG